MTDTRSWQPPAPLSDRARAWLDRALDDYMRGRLELSELPAPVAAFWLDGHRAGRDSLAPDLQQVAADRDRYYSLMHWPNPEERAAAREAFTLEALERAEAEGNLTHEPQVVEAILAAAQAFQREERSA